MLSGRENYIMINNHNSHRVSQATTATSGKNVPNKMMDSSGHKKTAWYCSMKVKIILCVILAYGCIFAVFISFVNVSNEEKPKTSLMDTATHNEKNDIDSSVKDETQKEITENEIISDLCPYETLGDLSPEEFRPKKGKRHMVDPPKDTNVSLVCCTTTAGPLSILVHHSWAPNGSKRFLEMVDSHYFEAKVPFMRCVKNFLCQFGLAGGSKLQRAFSSTIQDDPNWLPEGIKHRMNDEHVLRFAKGYMAYAGAGPHSRNNQFIIALKDNGPLGGGSPWEVPFAELVGEHSFKSLDGIYTGYGEHGPSQSLLWKENALERVKVEFPEIDYVTSCWISDRT